MTSTASNLQAELAQRFEAEQEIDHAQAMDIADRVLTAEQSIADAALTWVRTGSMPHEPAIEGHTPEELYRDYLPTQVFTILTGLHHDPRLVYALRRLPKRSSIKTNGPEARY